MSSAIDKALMAMSLEEDDDVPFVMPNLPEYCSTERNRTSSKKISVRKRPGKNKRNAKANAGQEDNIQISLKEGVLIGSV